ncbi:hypothetical protein J7K93_10805 [bacterium]|nr:hypothetical protein [bacterium]
MYNRIITHNDFDGIVSGALCSYFLNIDSFYFTGPRSVNESRFPVSENDVVCDLPYPLECGLWFDHHEGNLEELLLRGLKQEDIKGAFAPEKSCARVVINYFKDKEIPERFITAVDEADVIDAFDYKSIEDWRKETPGKIIEGALKAESSSYKDARDFMQSLLRSVRDLDIKEVAGTDRVIERWQKYCGQEEDIMRQIKQDSYFLKDDTEKELVVIDLTRHNRRPLIVKNLAYLIYPESKAVIEIKNLFHRGIKSNDIAVSMSLSLNLNSIENNYDVGRIMRELNIGDGHKGAGAGQIKCQSKVQMIKNKEKLLENILKMWREDSSGRM